MKLQPILLVLCLLIISLLSLSSPTASQSLVNPTAPDAVTTRVSIATDDSQGNGDSSNASVSTDGRYVTFSSSATNLFPGDTNGYEDIFVHDRQSGQTSRISVAADGGQANNHSYTPSISGNGRYVVFQSFASNLVPGDTNAVADVFVYDQEMGQTTRVSVASNAQQGNGPSQLASISVFGRYITFTSAASNLVPGDTNGVHDTFVHDQLTGQTTRVSVTTDGGQGNGNSQNTPVISADGRYVAFESGASNLVPGDTNEAPDIFVHDRQTGQTTRVSVAANGSQGNSFSTRSSMSTDGRFVAFESAADNLVSGDTNGAIDIFVRDWQGGYTFRVSVTSDFTQGNDNSQNASISASGRYVAFESRASNLVPGDNNGAWDVFVYDRQLGQTSRVSVASDGSQGNNWSLRPKISADTR